MAVNTHVRSANRADLDAIREAKQLLNQSGLVDVAEGLAQEAAVTRRLLGTPNQLEAIAATFENREPQFNASEESP